ncbi:MAG: hypothetical protein WC812_04070 [Candidatus Pacearchaeota archaeon]|jgi:CMP-N-acetylneuraminic acid synthetase
MENSSKMNYESVGIIAFKSRSERIPEKNLKNLGEKPLYYYMIKKALLSNLDKIFVITDANDNIKEEIKEMGAEIFEVPNYYFERDITGDKMLTIPFEKIDADIYVQLFVTAPFLRVETINEAIKILKENEHDSIFTINTRHDWIWYNGNPITYFPGKLPRSQDATPIKVETTGLYAIKKEALKELKRRIGNYPYMLEVDDIEGLDLDNPLDFLKAELFFENRDRIKKITGKDYL